MKATVDIPDPPYRQVKARAALQGRALRDVTIEAQQRPKLHRRAPRLPYQRSPVTAAQSLAGNDDGGAIVIDLKGKTMPGCPTRPVPEETDR